MGRNAGLRVSSLLALVLILSSCNSSGDTTRSDGGQPSPGTAVPATPALLVDAGRAAALDAVKAGLKRVLGYDYRTLSHDLDAAHTALAPTFVDEFDARIAPDPVSVAQSRSSTTIDVLAAGLCSGDGDHVIALVFADSTSTAGAARTRKPLRVVVGLDRDGDRWLISGLHTDGVCKPLDSDPNRQTALNQAQGMVDVILSVDYRNPERQTWVVEGYAHDPFRADFLAHAGEFVRTIRENRTFAAATIVGAALSSYDERRAAAVVAVRTLVQNNGSKPATRNYRILVTVVYVDGRWLVDGLRTLR